MRTRRIIIVLLAWAGIASCNKEDLTAPVITQNRDHNAPHFLGVEFSDPGAYAHDDHTCDLTGEIITENNIDIWHYGTYTVQYSVTDAAGNLTESERPVDIILHKTDYYDISYSAFDTCTSGNYFYTGLIQDCDCTDNAVTVGNISDYGLSASFTLPLSGQYNQTITLDTTKAGVYFYGFGTMSSDAQQLNWNYSIQDTVNTDVCRSVWIKN